MPCRQKDLSLEPGHRKKLDSQHTLVLPARLTVGWEGKTREPQKLGGGLGGSRGALSILSRANCSKPYECSPQGRTGLSELLTSTAQ